MTSLSERRLVSALIVVVALAIAAIVPGTASASSDLLKQCEGTPTKGHGSTFQAPILETWAKKFNESKNALACSGTQGSGGTPKVEYLTSLTSDKGSGACLKGWGAEVPESEATDFGEFGFCGTDEAPNPTQKFEIEKRQKGGESNSLLTIPVAQGAVAIIVHLPEGCKASSEIEPAAGKFVKLGRLVLEDSVLTEIYEGKIKTWSALVAAQKTGKDAIACIGGTESKVGAIIKYEEGGVEKELAAGEKATAAQEEAEIIRPVVRLDHSGTTHIFKTFLEQVNSSEEMEMEEYPEEIPGSGKKTGCGKVLLEEKELWSATAEACQNQRWPTAAHVVRPAKTGNPGVIAQVGEEQSSVGYADLAVAREKLIFSASCKIHPTECGGENTKGSATKVGEQHTKFWAEVQNSATPSAGGYADPSSNGDIEAKKQSNCANTVYSNEAGKKFPPASVREPWNQAKAELAQKKTYAICGLTYDLALRQYKFYPGTTKEEATTVENFLRWALNTKTEVGAEGGGALIKNSDYEKLPSAIIEEGEDGLEEVGFENPGISK
jgi:ABC-type phosphate transport system substrate-binding protein